MQLASDTSPKPFACFISIPKEGQAHLIYTMWGDAHLGGVVWARTCSFQLCLALIQWNCTSPASLEIKQ